MIKCICSLKTQFIILKAILILILPRLEQNRSTYRYPVLIHL